MENLTTTSLIEIIKSFQDEEQNQKMESLFKSFERLEIARLKSAYAHGRLDLVLNNGNDSDSYIKNKFIIND